MQRREHVDDLAQAIESVTGRKLRPRVFGKAQSKPEVGREGTSKKPVDEFIDKARQMKLNLIIEE